MPREIEQRKEFVIRPGMMEDKFKKATLEMVILLLLLGGEKYIDQVKRAIEEESGNDYKLKISPHVAFMRLLNNGLVSQKKMIDDETGRKRAYYFITDKGRDYLKLILGEYEQLSAGADRVIAKYKDQVK